MRRRKLSSAGEKVYPVALTHELRLLNEWSNVGEALCDPNLSVPRLDAVLDHWLLRDDFADLFAYGVAKRSEQLSPLAAGMIFERLSRAMQVDPRRVRSMSIGWHPIALWCVQEVEAPIEVLLTTDISGWSASVQNEVQKAIEARQDEVLAYVETEHPGLAGLPFEWIVTALRPS